ncbi:MAG TPA: PilZ domain-containing protein [Verrucomicrobiae bacterium]|nr:PilZ domain-containing protein [Verrucomicrobiae bacterium]
MSKDAAKSRRRYERIPTPKGLWVAWQHNNSQSVSRVRDLNVGGLFIAAPDPLPPGTTVTILLSVPEGEIRSQAVVRNITPGEGMGIEFRDMSKADAERLDKLVTRLLRSGPGESDPAC